MPRPIIALLSDFGLRDHYVASMKAAALAICPDAALVDITHEIPAQDVRAGAQTLVAGYRDFPPGAVFLAVVDPGVGSPRRAIAADAAGFHFVAPDNGLLSFVFAAAPPVRVVELARAEYARPVMSRTFEGRDRFAPAAAWIASGVAIEQLGPAIRAESLERLTQPAPAVSAAEIAGEIVRVDRFGNLITNVERALFDQVRSARPMVVQVAGEVLQVVGTYTDVPDGELCALFGSTDRLEIAANRGSAASRLGLATGARVIISPARD